MTTTPYLRMRRTATGLLAAMAALFVVAHWQSDGGVVWGYVLAFAEAAMIGGLADWFAVTALFRRPFGLPIPHTAVIPRNQGRIADAMAGFIGDNFLAPDLVAQRLERQDLAGPMGRWLSEPAQAARAADGLISTIPAILDTLDERAVSDFLRREAGGKGVTAMLAPAAASLIEAVTAQDRHQVLLDAALKEGWRWLETNEIEIRSKVRERTNWFFRLLTVDERAADALIGAIEDLMREVAADPNHPLRQRVTALLKEFADNLRNDPAMLTRVESVVRDTLAHPSVIEALEGMWSEAKQRIRAECAKPDSHLRQWAQDAFLRLGKGLLEDEALREVANERLRKLLVELAGRHGGDAARIVSDTIRSWDAATVVDKLEQNVGRDLQYIRLNGTIIGGLLGLALHAAAGLMEMLRAGAG